MTLGIWFFTEHASSDFAGINPILNWSKGNSTNRKGIILYQHLLLCWLSYFRKSMQHPRNTQFFLMFSHTEPIIQNVSTLLYIILCHGTADAVFLITQHVATFFFHDPHGLRESITNKCPLLNRIYYHTRQQIFPYEPQHESAVVSGSSADKRTPVSADSPYVTELAWSNVPNKD